MKKKHNNKKKQQKILIAVLIALIFILLLIIGIVLIKAEEKGTLDLGITEKIENLTGSNLTEDSDDETNSESDEEEEQEPQELLSAESAMALVKTNEEGNYVEDSAYTSGEIQVNETAIYSGQFVEDGRDELVKNVAAIQVTNNTDKYLEFAMLIYKINGETATFVATGLPAGKTAWVLEKSRLIIQSAEDFQYQGSTTAFRDDIVSSTEKIGITSSGNMLTATNKSGSEMENIVVYYKVLHDDGNYLGGITYVVDFGNVKAGESVETLAGHYSDEKAEIVRIDWQEK